MIRYNWNDIQTKVTMLNHQITAKLADNHQKIGSIVGIHRGGLIPAVMMSHRFQAPMVSLKWQTRDQDQEVDVETLRRTLFGCMLDEVVLIVDEIADSGKTLNDIHKQVAAFNKEMTYPVQVYYCVLIEKSSSRLNMPVMSAIFLDHSEWIHFPWESE